MEGLKYIGSRINLKSIRNFILDEGVSECDILYLNSINFYDIILEYREVYKEGISIPFYYLGVLVEEGKQVEIPVDRILHKRGINNNRQNMDDETEYYNGEEMYRCGYCGNVVDFDGSELDPSQRSQQIQVLQKFGGEVMVHHTHGKCCKDKWHS